MLSVRIAARRVGLAWTAWAPSMSKPPMKVYDLPSRVAAFACSYQIGGGDFSPAEREQLIGISPLNCTVDNTFAHVQLSVTLRP